MSDKQPAHQAIVQTVEAQRQEEPEPTEERRSSAVVGVVLLVVIVAGLGWWMMRSKGETPSVVPSREVLKAGSAELDFLPGTAAEDIVIVDERVEEDLTALRAAEIAWLDAGNAPRTLPPCPAQEPYRGLHPWGGPCFDTWKAATAWTIPASSPCRYQVFAAPPDDFRLMAECDADGNGEFETWAADRTTAPYRVRLNVK